MPFGLWRSIEHMRQGEKALIMIKPKWGFGQEDKVNILPLPQGWDMGAPVPKRHETTLAMPHAVLEHRAVLTLPNGTPFSHVVETYTSEVLAFPQPEESHQQ